MRFVLIAGAVVVILLSPAGSGQGTSDPAFDESFLSAADGTFTGPCHSGPVDILAIASTVVDGFIVATMNVRKLDDIAYDCDAASLAVVWHSHHIVLEESCTGGMTTCSVLANDRVEFEAVRDYFVGGGWEWSAEIEIKELQDSFRCEPQFRALEDTLEWRLPVSAIAWEFGCERSYSLANDVLHPTAITTSSSGSIIVGAPLGDKATAAALHT